jgi:hypothetical protein
MLLAAPPGTMAIAFGVNTPVDKIAAAETAVRTTFLMSCSVALVFASLCEPQAHVPTPPDGLRRRSVYQTSAGQLRSRISEEFPINDLDSDR